MANPVATLQGENLAIKIGDGATPVEGFTKDCLINTDRGIAFSSDVTDIMVPDCDDPSLPGWKQRLKDGMSAEISGAGVLHTKSVESWFNWVSTDVAKNVRVELQGVTGANGGGYWQGAFKLTQFEVTGNRKELSNASITLQSHGVVTWVDAP